MKQLGKVHMVDNHLVVVSEYPKIASKGDYSITITGKIRKVPLNEAVLWMLGCPKVLSAEQYLIDKYQLEGVPVYNISLDSFTDLESKNVFIHYSLEHYTNGRNLNFSVEFRDYPRAQTSWYNDDHEFGDVRQAMETSIRLAYWYLDNPRRIELINSHYTDEYKEYAIACGVFLNNFITDKHREFLKKHGYI